LEPHRRDTADGALVCYQVSRVLGMKLSPLLLGTMPRTWWTDNPPSSKPFADADM
jgi:hypothetical protein